MKSVIIACLFSILLISAGCEKNEGLKSSDVPEAVTTQFKADFPTAKSVTWKKDSEGYEAGFKKDSEAMEALYKEDGTFIESEVEIDIADLPAAIKSYVDANYSGAELEEADMVTGAEGSIHYDVEIEHNDDEFELVFDQDGNFLEMEGDDSDSGDDDGDDD